MIIRARKDGGHQEKIALYINLIKTHLNSHRQEWISSNSVSKQDFAQFPSVQMTGSLNLTPFHGFFPSIVFFLYTLDMAAFVLCHYILLYYILKMK